MGSEAMVVRMTGRPNGCMRTYVAELAFVNDGPDSYCQIHVGVAANQKRLAQVYTCMYVMPSLSR